MFLFAHTVTAVFVGTLCFKNTEFGQLTQVASGGGGVESKLAGDDFCCHLFFSIHEQQYVSQFFSTVRSGASYILLPTDVSRWSIAIARTPSG